MNRNNDARSDTSATTTASVVAIVESIPSWQLPSSDLPESPPLSTTPSCEDKTRFIESNSADNQNEYISQSFLFDNKKNLVLGEETAKKVTEYANDEHIQFQKLNPLFEKHEEKSNLIPKVNHSEIELGNLLGHGAFSNVFAIANSKSKYVSTEKHVIKILRKKLLECPYMFSSCVFDVAKEATILSTLPKHENIIQLHAISAGDLIQSYQSGRHDASFCILEKVDKTLEEQIDEWRRIQEQHDVVMYRKNRQSSFRFIIAGRATLRDRTHILHPESKYFQRRLQLGSELASAVAHLHANCIMHRDIKPANIGLVMVPDNKRKSASKSNGTMKMSIKLFDFDVATPVQDNSHQVTFPLKHSVGTKRFMPPEVALKQEYNVSADVYSYSLVLHNLLSLRPPFDKLNCFNLSDLVYEQGYRPDIPKDWHVQIQDVLSQGWQTNLKARPTMQSIHETLSNIVKEHQDKRRAKVFIKAIQKNSNKIIKAVKISSCKQGSSKSRNNNNKQQSVDNTLQNANVKST